MKLRLIFSALCASSVLFSAAFSCAESSTLNERLVTTESNDVSFGIDIAASRAHQEFDTDSADLTTVDLVPHLLYGNWDFSIDVPWQHAEGGYFVNDKFQPRLDYACGRVAQLGAFVLARHPKLAALNQYCQANGITGAPIDNSVSGVGDITAFARYGVPLDAEGIWLLSLGGGYKFANGDENKNLGSGTRNALLEATLATKYEWLVGSVTAGYAWLSGGDNYYQSRSSYGYGVADIGLQPVSWFTAGCEFDYDQSYIEERDAVKKTALYVRLRPTDHIGIKFYSSDYGSADGYPDREYGGSLVFMY